MKLVLVGLVLALAVTVHCAEPAAVPAGNPNDAAISAAQAAAHAEAAKAEKEAELQGSRLNGALSMAEFRDDEVGVKAADVDLDRASIDEGNVESLIKARITRREAKLQSDLASLKEAEGELASENQFGSALSDSESTLKKAENHASDEFEPKKKVSADLSEPSEHVVKAPTSLAEAKAQVLEAQKRFESLQEKKREEYQQWKKDHTKTGGWGDSPVTLEGQEATPAAHAAQAAADPAAVALSAAPQAAAVATVGPTDSTTGGAKATQAAAKTKVPAIPTAAMAVTPAAMPKKMLRN